MENANIIIDSLGREALRKGLGVADTAISNAKARGRLPAAWFEVVDAMCVERGIDCPRELFNWKRAEAPATKAKGAA